MTPGLFDRLPFPRSSGIPFVCAVSLRTAGSKVDHKNATGLRAGLFHANGPALLLFSAVEYGILIVAADNGFCDPTGVVGKAVGMVEQIRSTENAPISRHVQSVICRRIEEGGALRVCSDARSAKNTQLRAHPAAEMVFWLPTRHEQYRFAGDDRGPEPSPGPATGSGRAWYGANRSTRAGQLALAGSSNSRRYFFIFL
jgi:Pyridoxamine 5'-phosphate oxidase